MCVLPVNRIPSPNIPDPTLITDHIKDAIIIGIVAFIQSVSMSKILAKKNNYSINPSQVSRCLFTHIIIR